MRDLLTTSMQSNLVSPSRYPMSFKRQRTYPTRQRMLNAIVRVRLSSLTSWRNLRLSSLSRTTLSSYLRSRPSSRTPFRVSRRNFRISRNALSKSKPTCQLTPSMGPLAAVQVSLTLLGATKRFSGPLSIPWRQGQPGTNGWPDLCGTRSTDPSIPWSTLSMISCRIPHWQPSEKFQSLLKSKISQYKHN